MTMPSVFLNGRMVRARKTLLDALTPGYVCRKGVFETMRVYRGTVFALDSHLRRLHRGLRAMHIKSPCPTAKLVKSLQRTVRTSGVREGRIRLAVWREDSRTHLAIVCRRIALRNTAAGGIKAVISDTVRRKTKFSHIKSLDYACFRKAWIDADKKGYDEAVLLNNRGELVEGSRTNLFYVKGGRLYTPAVRCGCLNGITRQIVISVARRLDIPVRCVSAKPMDLAGSDESFVTNSLIGVVALTGLNGRRIASGKTGPVTGKIRDAYRQIVHSACSS